MSLLFGASISHAQFSAAPDPVQYIVAPENPGPNQPVNIEVQGVGSFLGDSTITWQQDGKTVSSGVGDSTYSFTTGGIGSATHIHLTINSSTNGTMTHDFYFAPSSIDLVWEAGTSVPLFYQGKPLYSAGSRLKVVAFPIVASGHSLVAANKLSYQWSRGDTPDLAQSGLGRNTYSFIGDQTQPNEDVSVDVYLDSTKVAHGEITIPATNPEVIFYDHDPLRGELLDYALPGTFNLDTNEVTLQAEPYYFDQSSIARHSLLYTWTLNSQETTGPDSARGLLTLRQSGQGAGAASVGVAVQNSDSDKFTQAAQALLQITFGQSGANPFTSLFGL